MEDPMMMGSDMNQQDPMMGGEMPMDNGGMEDPMMNNEMGDENNDPKKEIQQLSGKLSQELRNYNNDQQTPDTDLNKYVAGMVIPQATKLMTSDEKAEVINKIKKGMTDDDLNTDGSMNDMGGNNSMSNMPMESKSNIDSIINEIIGSIVNGDDERENREEKKITNKRITNKNPFVSKR